MADARCTDTIVGGILECQNFQVHVIQALQCMSGIHAAVDSHLSLECWQAARCKSDIHLEDAPFFIITCKNLMTTLLEGRMRT